MCVCVRARATVSVCVFACVHVSRCHVITGSAESFHYTSQGECVTINDVNDQSEFNATKEAMQLLGFHGDHLGGMFRVLSAILHLGNVEVGRCDKGGDVMSVIGEDDKHLVTATTLLGVDSAQLAHWLSHRKITTAREVYHKPLTHAQVVQCTLFIQWVPVNIVSFSRIFCLICTISYITLYIFVWLLS